MSKFWKRGSKLELYDLRLRFSEKDRDKDGKAIPLVSGDVMEISHEDNLTILNFNTGYQLELTKDEVKTILKEVA
jgi:hypothetical protein